jgi:microcystin-dependent protein
LLISNILYWSTKNTQGGAMSDPFIGEIRMMPYNFVQEGWLRCDGSIYSISEFTALFSIVNNTFGGNGHSTFGVPDLQGRVPVHEGSTFSWGGLGGYNQIELGVQHIPQHNHSLLVASTNANSPTPANDTDPTEPSNKAFAVTTTNVYTPFTSQDDLQPMQTAAISTYGTGYSHNNMQPYQAMGFFIAYQGLYPQHQ